MVVTNLNAAAVAAIFSKLADERFSMRTPAAIIKDTPVTEAQVLDVAAQMGMEFKRRIRDNALLIERPTSVTAAQAQEIAQKAAAIAGAAEGATVEPLDLNFADIMGAVEDSTGTDTVSGGANLLGDEEDRHFH